MGIGGTPLNGVSNFGGTEPLENYVPGQSCLAVNPNSHFDPTKTLALNPNAWSNQSTETFGDSAPYYSNCRWQRQPAESLSLGRIFRVKERLQLLIQAQFFNVFNRVVLSCAHWGNHQRHGCHVQQPVPGLRCCDRGVERRLRVCEYFERRRYQSEIGPVGGALHLLTARNLA